MCFVSETGEWKLQSAQKVVACDAKALLNSSLTPNGNTSDSQSSHDSRTLAFHEHNHLALHESKTPCFSENSSNECDHSPLPINGNESSTSLAGNAFSSLSALESDNLAQKSCDSPRKLDAGAEPLHMQCSINADFERLFGYSSEDVAHMLAADGSRLMYRCRFRGFADTVPVLS